MPVFFPSSVRLCTFCNDVLVNNFSWEETLHKLAGSKNIARREERKLESDKREDRFDHIQFRESKKKSGAKSIKTSSSTRFRSPFWMLYVVIIVIVTVGSNYLIASGGGRAAAAASALLFRITELDQQPTNAPRGVGWRSNTELLPKSLHHIIITHVSQT